MGDHKMNLNLHHKHFRVFEGVDEQCSTQRLLIHSLTHLEQRCVI